MDNLLTIIENNDNLNDVTLNFDALREEGTAYIAQLGHHLWTDFNSHDPGVTILEALCFAINDMAYRTSLPIEDLLAHPQGTESAPQFFTAAEILTCCPVTPLDFRKLMIDCEGVKNAWLFKANAEDQPYYREYYITKTAEEIKEANCIFGAIINGEGIPSFPTTSSYEEFIEELSNLEIEVEEQREDAPEGELGDIICRQQTVPGNYGEHIFHFLTQELEACLIRRDLSVLDSVFSFVGADINLSELRGGEPNFTTILTYHYLILQRGSEVGITTSDLIAFVNDPLGDETTSEIFRNFRNNILDVTNQSSLRTQINEILSLISYNEEGTNWLLNVEDGEPIVINNNISSLSPFMTQLEEGQFGFYSRAYNIRICANIVGLDQAVANNLVTTMAGFSEMSRLNTLLTFINSSEDLFRTGEYSLTNRLTNYGFVDMIFVDQINVLTSIEELTDTKLCAIKHFVSKFLEKRPDYQISNLAFDSLLTSNNITDENLISFLTHLTKNTETPSGAIQFPVIQLRSNEDIGTVISFFDHINTQIEAGNLNPGLSIENLTEVLNLFDGGESTYLTYLVETFIENCTCWRIAYCDDDEVPADAEPSPLNGLYAICLDLENNIQADDIIAIDEIKANVFNKLCEYRNLGEDFHSIDIVGVKPICINLSVVAEDSANVNQVEAEVYYKIQEFLNACPPFHSLQELLDQGLNCDEIYQSVILENGFLLSEEVEAAQLRRVIYKSDLYQEIMDIDGVKAIKCLDISLCNEDDQACAYDNEWCLDICQKDQALADEILARNSDSRIEKYTAQITCKYKPLLDIKASSVCIQKGRIAIPTNARDVQEKLLLLTQINRRPPVNAIRDTPVPGGSYRGLDEYASIQEDFPFVYRVGRGQLSNNLTPERKAQIKQLKAYLTFFDQLLANYLAQLDQVKNTLSTCPTPDDRGLFFGSLRGLDPEIDALLRDQYQMNNALIEQLSSILEEEEIGLLAPLNGQMPMEYDTFLQHIQNLLNRDNLSENIIQIIRTHGRMEGFYESQLADIVENDLERFNRRNKILDHLIARFGEQFTDYALSLYPVCPDDSCKTTQIKLKDSLLRCKTDFLKCIPALGRERGKGMNYKGDDCIKKELFWNSSNVTGLQQRVSKLLCLEQDERIQLSCLPEVAVVKMVNEARRCFEWVLIEQGQHVGSPDVPIYLHGLREYTLRAKGKKELENIRKNLFEANQFVTVDGAEIPQLSVLQNDDNTEYTLVLHDKTGKAIAKSQSFGTEQEATVLRKELMQLIFPNHCENEGFHVIEHILLRPFQKDLPSLLPICPQAGCKVNDAYSFWITVVAPAGWKRFSPENGGRTFFEQVVREQTPAHIGICFLWLEGEELYHLELAYKNWLYDLARQGADDCEIEESLGDFVDILNDLLGQKCLDEGEVEDTGCAC